MATPKQEAAVKKSLENIGSGKPKSVGEILREVGYSPAIAKNPQIITRSKGWKELTEQYLNDNDLTKAHNELLNSRRIDHMVFPLIISDEEITELLLSVNCTPRKFMHSETATHVWFWSPDNKAKKDALDMAYKIKGKYPKNEDPENSQSKQLVESLLKIGKFLTVIGHKPLPQVEQLNDNDISTDEYNGNYSDVVATENESSLENPKDDV